VQSAYRQILGGYAMKKYDKFLKENKAKKIWNAAVYVRLSKEDGDKIESDSITSQKDILSEFVNHKDDIKISDFYIDDGWSGANFERPAFSRMMSDIYAKKVNCVIVKDLSRFGRNYADSSRYIDDIFVKLNIRFIALNSGVDTVCEHTNPATQCITVGIQNVINESYIANTSVSIRGALDINRKQGKFIGSFATYGYLKDPDDYHKLVIDDEAAEVVRTIFKWFIEGKSVIGITKNLNALGIPNPSEYKRQKGFNYKHTNKNNDGLWCDSTVRRMLRNQMYIGNMVQGKNTNLSYKIKKCRAKPKEEWIIVESTHEPIIDKETFEKAQSLFNRNTRTSPKKTEVDLFSGFVKCADCHRAMSKKVNNHTYGVYKYYRCVTASKKSKTACSPHSIRIDVLEKTVLSSIQNMIDTAVELEKILDKINKQAVKNGDTLTKKALDKLKNDRENIKKISLDLYPDYKANIITLVEYEALKKNMASKIADLDIKIAEYEKTIETEKSAQINQSDFIKKFTQFGKIDKLNRPILCELVDSILVHKNGDITINFKFMDVYEQLVDYLNETKQKYLDHIA
jgi:site-specific DNA recombinase